jgi:uncharacterized protein (DUF488 family)
MDKEATEASPGSNLRVLTQVVVGKSLSMSSLFELVEKVQIGRKPAPVEAGDQVWVGSVGYEKHRDVDAFAVMLASAGVERLVDVRELPISRKRGFAKTALSEALERAGIEYVHVKALGNPKTFRDLYKSGEVEAGRSGYERFLLSERLDALASLEALLQEKRSALMCVESDQSICHRDVIFEALCEHRNLELRIAPIA